MILLIVSAFVAPLAFGWVCTNPLLPVSRSSLPGTLLRLALTLGIGLGFLPFCCSCGVPSEHSREGISLLQNWGLLLSH